MLKKLSFTAITLLIILAGLWITIKINYPTVQPPVIVYYYFDHLLHPGAQMKKDIIGFLPYWRLDDIQYIHHDLISEINYFALYSDENGNFIKASSTAEGTGWANLQNDNVNVLAARTQISGGKFSISIAAQRNKIIENLLDSDNARQNLIQNTLFIANN